MNTAPDARFESTPDGHRLSGAIVQATATRLLAEGERALTSAASIRVDLADVTAIDSAGVAVLIAWAGAASRQGRSIAFVGASPATLAFVRAAGVETLLGL